MHCMGLAAPCDKVVPLHRSVTGGSFLWRQEAHFVPSVGAFFGASLCHCAKKKYFAAPANQSHEINMLCQSVKGYFS